MASVPLPTTPAPRFVFLRLVTAFWRQEARCLVCPKTPRLDGAVALVTGGNAGIGLETCRGLLERGARVIMAVRDQDKAAEACARLRAVEGRDLPLEHRVLDLSDLDSVAACARGLEAERIDVFVANAGVWPRAHGLSPQGHEIAFATNVLGHHLLLRLLEPRLGPGARVVLVTGDIYCLASACTSDYRYRGSLGGMLAYCRSKLGTLWEVAVWQARHVEWRVVAVHPGVVASGLGGRAPGRSGLSCARGAQTSLFAATQPDVPPGAYLHNTLGLVRLPKRDPALDRAKAAELWERCEELCAPWLGVGGA
jgi:NAD(P)-dependent dehydrogenase (short-subunit alcohol dehydrogenase family)